MPEKKKNKRIELNEEVSGVRLRASRTGGFAASASPAKGITLNSKHGVRVSKTFKGLTLGAQNFKSVVRGRWSAGSMNINLSKSGISASNKNIFGTFNFRRPKLSSSTIFGFQVRGSVAMIITFVGMIISLVGFVLNLLAFILPRLFIFSGWLMQLSWNFLIFLGSFLIYLFIDFPKQLLNIRK